MRKTIALALFALLAFAGCRREDIREFDVEISGLERSMEGAVKSAFFIPDPRRGSRAGRWYDGVYVDELKFDYDRHLVRVRYDSMKIAQTNIRMLIESKGLKVVYPENTTGRAGK